MFTSAEALTIFGATYDALYARFASKWGYIANLYNLYNQIKQSEVDAAGSAQAAAPGTPGGLAMFQIARAGTYRVALGAPGHELLARGVRAQLLVGP